MATKSTTAERVRSSADPVTLALVCFLAWILPGLAHVWLGRRQKGIVFLVVLSAMFVIGLMLKGRIYAFTLAEPLIAMGSLAELALGILWMGAKMVGAGAGQVTATTFEYGSTFIIVAGLLNLLVMLDAFDIAMGRK